MVYFGGENTGNFDVRALLCIRISRVLNCTRPPSNEHSKAGCRLVYDDLSIEIRWSTTKCVQAATQLSGDGAVVLVV